MGPNPITHEAIEAFQRTRLYPLGAWAVELIERLDEVVLKAWSDEAKAQPRPDPREPAQIPVTNTAGVRALLQGLAVKKAAQAKAQAAQPSTPPARRR